MSEKKPRFARVRLLVAASAWLAASAAALMAINYTDAGDGELRHVAAEAALAPYLARETGASTVLCATVGGEAGALPSEARMVIAPLPDLVRFGIEGECADVDLGRPHRLRTTGERALLVAVGGVTRDWRGRAHVVVEVSAGVLEGRGSECVVERVRGVLRVTSTTTTWVS